MENCGINKEECALEKKAELVFKKEESGAIPKRVRVGSRKSQLALFQSNFVVDLLRKCCTNTAYDIVTMATTGDRILDVALSKIGEKSLFTKELEIALENDDVHMIVHSLKDLPTSLPSGMVIGAICKREDPFDVVVFKIDSQYRNLNDLPEGSVIGTSSLRRIAQLKKLYPHLSFQSVRGNINTRLRKLDEDKTYSALILAAAGLIRLDLAHRITQTLTPEECLHAVGQGALAIECKESNLEIIKLLSKISDKETTLCCVAERAFMKALEGGCSVPVAVYSLMKDDKLILKGGVFSLDGSKSVIEELSAEVGASAKYISNKNYVGIVAPHIPHSFLNMAENTGKELAVVLLKKGAGDILNDVRTQNGLS